MYYTNKSFDNLAKNTTNKRILKSQPLFFCLRAAEGTYVQRILKDRKTNIRGDVRGLFPKYLDSLNVLLSSLKMITNIPWNTTHSITEEYEDYFFLYRGQNLICQ